MNADNILLMLAIVAVIAAFFNVSVTFIKIADFRTLTGYASTVTGTVNITVNTQIALNMTNNTIEFGGGAVDAGATNATIKTNGQNTPTVTSGNWTTAGPNKTALSFANVGNVNASIDLASVMTAAGLFGSKSSSNQQYMWNITTREANSCNATNVGGYVQGTFNNTNTTLRVCDTMGFLVARNEMYIDILMMVPYDASNATAVGKQLQDTITITAGTAI